NILRSQGGGAIENPSHVCFHRGWTPCLVACILLHFRHLNGRRRAAIMQPRTLQTLIAPHIRLPRPLENICTSYLLFLIGVTTKHSLENAARFSARHKSQFSKLLQHHGNVAVYTLESLSKQQAKQLAKALNSLQGLPWKIADSIGFSGKT